jgi:RsiW-degrading membrane proteinase PrsW (M82 family)
MYNSGMIDTELTAALAVAITIPLLFLTIIYARNLYATHARAVVMVCFGWGVLAFGLAFGANRLMVYGAGISPTVLTRYAAPITEEILKAFILIYLVRRADFTYFVDGAIYGFAVGIGFAVAENVSLIFAGQPAALGIVLGRVISSNLVHAAASALVGVTLGLGRFRRAPVRRALYVFGGLIVAELVHGGFNNLVSRVPADDPLLLGYAALVGFGGVALILFLIQRGLAEERAWIQEMLGVADRVTRSEAQAVHHLAETGILLAPLAERLGRGKASQIARLLILQARLGILRKTVDRLPDEELRKDVDTQIEGLQVEMEAQRRAIGAYGMLFLRSVFPGNNRSIWQRLEAITAAADEDVGITPSDLLADLPMTQRHIMRVMIRRRGRAARSDLVAELETLPGDERPSRQEVDVALEALVGEGMLVGIGEAPVSYEVNLGRKRGARLGDNIWAALGQWDAAPSDSAINAWAILGARLQEQAASQAGDSADKKMLWDTLAQRMPSSSQET